MREKEGNSRGSEDRAVAVRRGHVPLTRAPSLGSGTARQERLAARQRQAGAQNARSGSECGCLEGKGWLFAHGETRSHTRSPGGTVGQRADRSPPRPVKADEPGLPTSKAVRAGSASGCTKVKPRTSGVGDATQAADALHARWHPCAVASPSCSVADKDEPRTPVPGARSVRAALPAVGPRCVSAAASSLRLRSARSKTSGGEAWTPLRIRLGPGAARRVPCPRTPAAKAHRARPGDRPAGEAQGGAPLAERP